MTRRSAFRERCFEHAGFGNARPKQYVVRRAFGAKLEQSELGDWKQHLEANYV
jgi:hypothetical protein